MDKYKILPEKEIISALKQKDFHPARVVILEEDPKWSGNPTPSKPSPNSSINNKVTLVEEKNNILRLWVSCSQNSLLVLSDYLLSRMARFSATFDAGR